MPSNTLGRKRRSEAIISDGTQQAKKIKFTDDGEAVVSMTAPVPASPTTHVSKVKPDYSKMTRKGDKKGLHAREDAKEVHRLSSMLNLEDVDFPRGGGSGLTPLEHREMRAEGVREAEMELFKEKNQPSLTQPSRKRLRNGKPKLDAFPSGKNGKSQNKDAPRIEYLSYKKLIPGTRVLAQVVTTTPLSIIVSLPHYMLGHVPIDKVSKSLNDAVEKLVEKGDVSDSETGSHDEEDADEDNSMEENESKKQEIPTIQEIFHPGQYVQAIVMAVHPHGVVSPQSTSGMSLGKPRNELEKASRRVELSVLPNDVNSGITSKDLGRGFTLPASVASIEDHGYVLDFGIPDMSGFLSFKDAKEELQEKKSSRKLKVGMILDTYIKKTEENGRICVVGVGGKATSSELSNLTSTSAVHPGALVRGLITAVSPSGINVQVLGLFNGTIHPLHISADASKLQVGKKVLARILWDVLETEPRQFALSTLEHILKLVPRSVWDSPMSRITNGDKDGHPEDQYFNDLERAYPIGTILDNAKVSRVDPDRALFFEITQGPHGMVHISDVSDEHVPTLSPTSGVYKVGSVHRVRVTGYHHFDGILQCSMKESILQRKWLRVNDVNVGEMVKGTIVNLTDRGLFVAISGNVHAVVWPNHYADIRLKHPERKFKVGKSIKCRVLVVDPEKNRICLTAKKTLIESSLPIISNIAEVQVSAVAHATIFKISERYLSVEFYNAVKGMVPMREATDSTGSLEGLFNIGQVVKVRIIEIKQDGSLLIASILKATSDFVSPTAEISKIQIGSTVSGAVTDVHKDNAVLRLIPSQLTALLSLNNLANFRSIPVFHLRASLKVGEVLDDLVVVSKNSEKALLIVAAQPKQKPRLPAQDPSLTLENLQVGRSYPGLVIKQSRRGVTVRLTKHVFGTLHPTDLADDYSTINALPSLESVVNAVVISVDGSSRQVALSTRASRLRGKDAARSEIVDPEILDIKTLKVGQMVRGFVKSVADAGLFVSLSRVLDARVQIKELFDEYVKDWKPRFKENQLVQGRILDINTDTNQIEMTLRPGDLTRTTLMKSLANFSKGDRVDGVVKKVEEYGVFVEIKGTKVSGLCHRSEIVDQSGPTVAEVLQSLKEGDPVRALVLSVDTEKKRISFGLKPSYFFDEDLQDESRDNAEDAEAPEGNMVDETQQRGHDMQDPDEEADSVDEEILYLPKRQNEATDPTSGMEGQQTVPTLSLKAPLRWDATTDAAWTAESTSEASDDETDEPVRKKRKRKHEIQQDLTVNIQQRAPQSTTDFERLLLSSPNSSYLWLQFMAFQLQLSEIEKARDVGRRALKAINFREEQERLNVWIALLNLEISYGTDASLDAVFKEAARANDSKTVHWRLAVLLDESQKHERAEEQFRKTCKKFGSGSKVWTLFAEHYFKRSMQDEARQLLPRSLLSLDKRKHLKTIAKFAQLEYNMGDPERGRTIFEGIIDTHSKRLDLWNIYIDMEAGQNNIQRIRGIFERAIALKLSKKKAKFLFKKWLELERRLGDEKGADFVKQKAVEWTQNAAKGEHMPVS